MICIAVTRVLKNHSKNNNDYNSMQNRNSQLIQTRFLIISFVPQCDYQQTQKDILQNQQIWSDDINVITKLFSNFNFTQTR